MDSMSTTINGVLEHGGITASKRKVYDTSLKAGSHGMPHPLRVDQPGATTITQAIKNRTDQWKPQFNDALVAPGRFSRTFMHMHDTFHTIQPFDPKAAP